MAQGLIAKMESLFLTLTERKESIDSLTDGIISDIRTTIKQYRSYYRDLSDKKPSNYFLMEDAANSFLPQYIKEFERHQLETSKSQESKILMLRMVGDFKRYLVEFNENQPEKKSMFIQESLISYKEAMGLCDELPVDNYTKLATTLNFVVLLADEMREIDEAISLAEATINSVKDKKLDDERNEIIRILKENLEYFKQNRDTYLTDVKIK